MPGADAPLSVRAPVRPDLINVWRDLPWWSEAVAAMPELAADAAEAERTTALLRAREEQMRSTAQRPEHETDHALEN